jgi:site-specific recombinase XerD
MGAWLTEPLQQYFHSVSHGLEPVLPLARLCNKPFLLNLFKALQAEPYLTAIDLNHIQSITVLADEQTLPPLETVKQLIEAEAYLINVCITLNPKRIKEALNYAFLLLTRHGFTTEDLTMFYWKRLTSRMLQHFDPLVQPFVTDWIDWMVSKQFAPRTILDCVREFLKLSQWMQVCNLTCIDQLDERRVYHYLTQQGKAKPLNAKSKQRVYSNLASLFSYYKDGHNGGFTIPKISFKSGSVEGVNSSATSEEIAHLWGVLEGGSLSAKAGLMLVLILGHGLPLKTLPLLRVTPEPGNLAYTLRLGCRRGEQERTLRLALNRPWLRDYWEAYQLDRANLVKQTAKESAYLFVSRFGVKRGLPVSVDTCQRDVQQAVKQALGYAIPVNHLERGSLKAMARQHSITQFMALSEPVPLTRKTRMMVWLNLKTT